MLSTLFLVGCQKSEDKSATKTGKTVNVEQLATRVRGKYEDDSKADYSGEKLEVKRDEALKLDIGFDPEKEGMKNFTEVVEVFQDPDLTQAFSTQFELNDDHTEIQVKPWKTPVAAISTLDLKQDVDGNETGALHLFDKGDGKDWGNLPMLYMAVYVDLETGEKLDKPIVTPINVKNEIEQEVKVKMTIGDDGLPVFSWDKVKGADYYYVISLDYSNAKGYNNQQAFVQGRTDKLSWSPKDATHLRTYKVSELERRDAENIKKYGKGDEPIQQESSTSDDIHYAVIAVSSKGTSALSNALSKNEMAKRIVYTQEVGLTSEEEGKSLVDDYQKLPAYAWVTMCDGSLVQKWIDYKFDKAEEKTETWGEYEKEDMSDLKATKVDIVDIPYQISGTGYTGHGRVQDYDKKTVKADLKALKVRQDQLANKGGSKDATVTTESDDTSKDKAKSTGTEISDDQKITANSALSEYLAVMMMGGETLIDLSDFPEAQSEEVLVDAWQEATYQNPLILGVDGARLSLDGKTMLVSYEDSPTDMLKKQDEIKKEVTKVVKEIIKPDMTDLQKEYAINAYLTKIAEYDDAALENAEKNDFKKVDEKFNDSFTPYGVLINKVGVCASYASAFKLLADEAKLDTIVVTGYLDGEVPHAWNKVKIGDEWAIVDATNNDNDMVTNALLNLPSKSSQKVLVEDDRYAINSKLATYKASDSDTDKEFYHVEKKFYNQDKIATELIAMLNKDGKATLRTTYELDDAQFGTIGQKVAETIQNEGLKGFYWMGVIYLTTEGE
ncbi:transglutaminase domain-containing protein [Pseudolactococcus yaeyamensis]